MKLIDLIEVLRGYREVNICDIKGNNLYDDSMYIWKVRYDVPKEVLDLNVLQFEVEGEVFNIILDTKKGGN